MALKTLIFLTGPFVILPVAVHAAPMKRCGFLRNKIFVVFSRMAFPTSGIGGFAGLQIFFGMAKQASRGAGFQFLIMALPAAVVGGILQAGDIFVRRRRVTRTTALRLRLPVRSMVTIGAVIAGFGMSFMIKCDRSKFHMMTLQA